MTTQYGNVRFDLTLQPVSGVAVPVYQGEVLRIAQVEGSQCVDFNCYNLHDYKEHMSVGPSAGFRKVKGDVIMTRHPRSRPILAILEMPKTCVTDVIAPGCSSPLFKRRTGLDDHTNCQHTFATCIAEYGLAAEDIHNSFNLWMNSGWTEDGKYYSSPDRNTGKKGDYVDFLVLMDILAVPVTAAAVTTATATADKLSQPIQAPSPRRAGIKYPVRETPHSDSVQNRDRVCHRGVHT